MVSHQEVSSSFKVHHPCVFVPYRRLLCRIRSSRPQDHGVGLHLQLCHCWGVCGIFHRLELDPGVSDWHCGRCQCSEQHVWLAGQPHHQPLDGGQRGNPQWPRWVSHILLPQHANLLSQIKGFPFQDAVWKSESRALNMSFFPKSNSSSVTLSRGNQSNFHKSFQQKIYSSEPYL